MKKKHVLLVEDNQNIDLVLTDQSMPGMTGLKLIETLQTLPPATRTILITASDT
jgi:YesN/AraC family two-component response regulator